LNNQEKFIATLVSLLKDPKQLQSLSNGAYAHLDAISNEATWRQWAPVVENK
jgi:hypothetical protein